jgi:hypothetical protein
VSVQPRWIATLDSVPWGLVVFILVAIGGLVALVLPPTDLTLGEYLGAISVGAGLHGVGHGIRQHKTRTPEGQGR